MNEILRGLAMGLIIAVLVIILLLTANFQSVRLAFVVISTAPAVAAGVVVSLYLTGSTLNLQSFMGAIMAIGVAVANSILLVTFAEPPPSTGGSSCRAGCGGRRYWSAPSHLDDKLCDDRGHVADGPGLERRERADGAPCARGHRRAGRGDAGNARRAAGVFRDPPGRSSALVGVDRSGRPYELALRSSRLGICGECRRSGKRRAGFPCVARFQREKLVSFLRSRTSLVT